MKVPNYLDITQKKEAAFDKKLQKEQETLKRNLEEKYRADKISYKAMQKRLEYEKQKTRQLQEDIEDIEK